jgi:DNA-binding SARP family transcriptional activator/tetratricopeptide (TPR) repeat protein
MRHRNYLFSLGTPRLENEAGDEVRLGTRKHLALLVYLAVEPTAHRRDWLIEFLWPASDGPTGRQSLATALSLFRGKLGREAVAADGHTVQLIPGAVELDVDRLLKDQILGTDTRSAIDLDGFLNEFEINDAPEFGMWRDRQRTRLLPRIKAGLVTLMDHARRSGDISRLGRYGDRLLALDDLTEEGIRAQMEVSAFAGDRLTAIRIYDAWSQRLLRELGATPSRQLDGMAVRLRRRAWERPRSSVVPEVRTEEWRDRPFCGRTREYRAIYDLWEGVKNARPCHVLLMGESGVGKTTLIDRLATSLAMEGAAVVRVRCFEMERSIPYAALASGLGRLIDQPGAAATSPASLAEIARFVPEARTRFPDLPAPVDAPGESTRIQFAEAVLELLTAVMEEQPVVLVIDDYHIADEASLTVLHMLIRRLPDRPLMVLLSARPLLPPDGGASRIRDGAERLGLTEMTLEPMPLEEGNEYLDTLVRDLPSGPSLVERRILLGTSGGFPLALEHLVADWTRRGSASLALSLGGMSPHVPSLPGGTYHRLAGSLTDSLSPLARLVLGMAAILDRRIGELPLYALVGISVPQALAGIAELVAKGAMRDAEGELEFTSPMTRASAYLDVPGILRQTVHAQVADILLARDAEGENLPGLEVAWHCVRGGRSDRVAPFLLRGAREAMIGGAPHEAELALRSGLPLLMGMDRSRGLVLLAEVANDLSLWQESLDAMAMVEVVDEQLRIEITVWTAVANDRLGRLPLEEQRVVVATLAGIVHHPDTQTAVRLEACHVLAGIVEALGTDPGWNDLLHTISKCPPNEHDTYGTAKWLVTEARLYYTVGNLSAALSRLREAESVLERTLPLSKFLAFARLGIGAVECAMGNYSQALGPTLLAYRGGIRLDNKDLVCHTATNMALIAMRLGTYEESVSWADIAISGMNQVSSPKNLIATAYAKSAALIHLGRKEKALGTMRAVLCRVHGNGFDRLEAMGQLRLADIQVLLGRRRDALRTATNAVAHDPTSGSIARHHGLAARWSAILAAEKGEPESCHPLLSSLWRASGSLDAIDRVELLLASEIAGFELDSADDSVAIARETAARLPAPTLHYLGRLTSSRARRPRAIRPDSVVGP